MIGNDFQVVSNDVDRQNFWEQVFEHLRLNC